MDKSRIDFALPTLNPKLGIFRCPNDCSVHCPQMIGIVNNNLNNCNCSNPQRHRVGIFEEDGKLVLKCKTCGTIILKSSIDPLRKYNIALMNLTKPYRAKIRPLIYLSLCNSTLQAEIDFLKILMVMNLQDLNSTLGMTKLVLLILRYALPSLF